MNQLNRRDFLNLLKLMPLAFLQTSGSARQLDTGLPNFLVVVFDTLGANHMSLYGYPRDTTPNLNRIAEKAIVYHNHQAAGNFTTPGTASILTGTYPWTHRAINIDATVSPDLGLKSIFELLTPQYQTFAYTHNSLVYALLHQFLGGIDDLAKRAELFLYTSLWADSLFEHDFMHFKLAELLALSPKDGLASTHILSRFFRSNLIAQQNFLNEHYSEFPRGVPNDFLSYYLLEDAVSWTKKMVRQQPRPFFGYLHFLPPHYFYTTRKEFIDIFSDDFLPAEKEKSPFGDITDGAALLEVRQHYDEYIPYVDAEFERLFDFMEQEDMLKNTYLIITSDHGESFERGVWQHTTPLLSEELTRVPLMIWGPNINERIDIHNNTSCTDLLPTLLHLAGQPAPAQGEGEILPPFSPHPGEDDRPVFTLEAKENPAMAPLHRASLSMVKGPYKIIHYFGYPGIEDFFELYHLGDDPEEMNDLYQQNPSFSSILREELLDKLADVDRGS